jgi:hypothetical protein
MTRAALNALHLLLDRYEELTGVSLLNHDEYSAALSDLRLEVIAHVEQIEGYARRTARRSA